jgi:hypothetical protein
MTISYPLSLPSTPSFRTMRISAENVSQIVEAPFALNATVYERDGERWRFDMSFPSLQLADARIVQAFLVSLNGQVGTFLAGDPMAATPGGSVPGTPVVNGGGQVGKVLSTRGWTASQSNILKKGDYIQIANRLYMVCNDASSDGSGISSLDIWPSIRQTAPGDGVTITTLSPKGLFRLDSNIVEWTGSYERFYEISFSGVEAL